MTTTQCLQDQKLQQQGQVSKHFWSIWSIHCPQPIWKVMILWSVKSGKLFFKPGVSGPTARRRWTHFLNQQCHHRWRYDRMDVHFFPVMYQETSCFRTGLSPCSSDIRGITVITVCNHVQSPFIFTNYANRNWSPSDVTITCDFRGDKQLACKHCLWHLHILALMMRRMPALTAKQETANLVPCVN